MVQFIIRLFSVSSGNYVYILGALLLAILSWSYQRHQAYFSKQNVPYVRGFPLVGSMFGMLRGKDSFAMTFENFYKSFPNDRFVGIFDIMGAPVYLIRDPQLIKQITIKDFDHFVNHRSSVGETSDSLLSRSISFMRDQRWRNMRSTLSPAFTGSKMRLMLSLVSHCANEFSGQLLTDSVGTARVYDLKDLFFRYASDTIATSAFGVEVNSLRDKDNQFFETGVAISNISGMQMLKLFGYSSMPALMNFFKVKFFSNKQARFFRDLVHDTVSFRETSNVVRHDMIHLLMEARKGYLQHEDSAEGLDIGFATVNESAIGKSARKSNDWHDDDFVAQCMIFFLAGFSAVTGAVCFMAHELACNPDIQQRLYEEVNDTLSKLNGSLLTYEAMQQMKYLDMVVSETLRRWSISPANDRYVNKPYVLEKYDGTKVKLNVGDGIWLPTCALHMDPQYFPDPERFDPDRFSDANKENIMSGVYMPFGIGPRSCIGSRFALMEMKALFVYLLSKFTIAKCDKTQDPLVLKKGVAMEGEKGFWAELRPRVLLN